MIKYCLTGLCVEAVSALKPACAGAGAEVDCPPRDVATIVTLLTCGGYRLSVVASSDGWTADCAQCSARGAEGAGRSIGGMEVRVVSPHVDSRRWGVKLSLVTACYIYGRDARNVFLSGSSCEKAL